MNDKNDDKFDSQSFLLANLDNIIPQIQDTQKYNNIYVLQTTSDNPTSKVVSLLTNKTESTKAFTKLKTHQYNALIPKITLYRVDHSATGDKTEREFVFKKDTLFTSVYSDLSKTPFLKGRNSGVKNIKWEIAGTDPVSAEKTISATIEFYFDSVNSFSGGSFTDLKNAYLTSDDLTSKAYEKFNTANTTTNYWSLIFHPSFNKQNNGISNQEDTPKDYDTTKFRIKCVVGWADLNPNIKNDLFSNVSNIDDAITNLTTSMYLNLIKHEFKFNEDGSLFLTATYVASLENSLRSDKMDLLGGLKEKLNDITKLAGEGLTSAQTTEEFDKLQKAINDSGVLSADVNDVVRRRIVTAGNADSLRKALALVESYDKLDECKDTLPQGIKQILQTVDKNKLKDDLTKQLNVIGDLIDQQKGNSKKDFYSKFLQKMFKNESSNFYSIKLSGDQVKEFISWKKNEVIGLLRRSLTINQVTDNSLSQQAQDLISKLNANNTEIDLTQQQNDSLPTTTEVTVRFTTIGSLIDTAINIVSENLSYSDKEDFKRFKILLGNFSDEAPLFQVANTNLKNVAKNIAYLPVDFDRFLLFYSKEVVEKSLDSYPFFIFLKNLINSLIYSSLNGEGIDNKEINKYADVSIAGVTINLGNTEQSSNKNYLDTVVDGNRVILSEKITEAGLKPYYIKNTNNSNHKNYTSIYFLFDKYQKDFFGKGKQSDDEKKGIFHYTVAQDYGLIKAINFKRIDQPFLKEAKSVGKKTFFLGQFRDIYNVELKMIGNNIYYPGMVLFIVPSIEFGNPAKINSFSQITGIGGYFQVIKVSSQITEDGYDTTLDCVYQASGDEAKTTSKSGCEDILQDIGLGNGLDSANELAGAFQLTIVNSIISLQSEKESLSSDDEALIADKNQQIQTLIKELRAGGQESAFALIAVEQELGKYEFREIENYKKEPDPTTTKLAERQQEQEDARREEEIRKLDEAAGITEAEKAAFAEVNAKINPPK